ncbi:hypothetical protein HX787_20425 [Pseudomonas tolaasii]|uniref:Uncharacterized protein n=1 Tax=Pseudomonas tolaasii TaxID=29442 RepID=A0A7Y8AQ06_PSETO|nr:hypothetical protein [Pseudomonas tolaasii]NWC24037.1 hypothetical protein [Pseudomonas tolaasii]NWD38234.1 hypothetical protein [Pseudomonas tolaasii]
MKTIITMILLLIVGQASAGEQLIDVLHDSARGVTCWILNNAGISCLPDSSLLQQDATTAAPEDEGARASLAVSPVETGPDTAAPLPQQKGFQL